jgi:hypothetical protein
MSQINLQSYFDTIKKKTGKTPADFRKAAELKGYLSGGELKAGIKAGEIFQWLKEDFGMGRGHGMAIYHALKEGLA